MASISSARKWSYATGPDADPCVCQDSSKGGVVETGCSDLYDVIY